MKARDTHFARNPRRRLLYATGVLLLVATSLSAIPSPAAASGCCEAVPAWSGSLDAHAVFDDQTISQITGDVLPGWENSGALPLYFLPAGGLVRVGAYLEISPVSIPSVGRYWWQLDCGYDGVVDAATDVRWTDPLPGGSGNPFDPPTLVQVTGDLNIGDCPEGFLSFRYDQGDPAYGMADITQFQAASVSRVTGQLDTWAWVTPEQAQYVQSTGSYPITTQMRVGMYAFTAYTYASRASYLFGTTSKLIRGTISGSEAFLDYASNTGDIQGLFFPKSAVGQVTDFQVVQ